MFHMRYGGQTTGDRYQNIWRMCDNQKRGEGHVCQVVEGTIWHCQSSQTVLGMIDQAPGG